jgi:hypothetical protein
LGLTPEDIEDLWKLNQNAYLALEVIRDRLKYVSTLLRDAKGDMDRYGPLDREFNQVHREWDVAFALFMGTNERFREATSRYADEQEAETRRIRKVRPPS